MKTLTTSTPALSPTPTSIVVGYGALSALPRHLERLAPDRVVILYDRAVKSIANAVGRLCQEYDPLFIAVPSGDASKSLTEVERIASLMLEARCSRDSVIVAVGGGMVTDLGGFVASVFMRGIPSVLVPTSILAMVDAAVGGKTGVNVGTRKNMVGTFSLPAVMICDLDTVKNLSPKLLAEGLVEVVKVAAISNRDFFVWLEKNLPRVLAREKAVLEECVLRSIDAKLAVVGDDTHDRSQRLFLNFGHTIGHAVEAVSSFRVPHGAAVAIGMALEMSAGKTRDASRVLALLEMLGMPLDIPKAWKKKDRLWEAMLTDKKSERGTVRIAVPSSIGKGTVQTLPLKRFLALL